MPTLTRTNLRDLVRLKVRDTSVSSPGLLDAQVNILLDEALFEYAAQMDGDEVLFSSESDSLSAGSNSVTVGFAKTPTKIEAVYLSGVSKLRRATVHEMFQKQAEDPNEVGEPEAFAFEFGEDRTDATCYFNCKADIPYTVVTWYRKEPAAFTGDSATCPLGDTAAYVIANMTAVKAALLLGRPGEFVSALASTLPDTMRPGYGVAFRSGTHGGPDPRRAS